MGKIYNILVVDDEKSIRFTTKEILSKEGYEVLTANGYCEALDIMAKKDLDLIFADVMLDDKTGFDVLLEAKKQNPTCPVVLITGYPNKVSETEAFRLGALDYVSKPLTKDKLLHMASMILHKKKLVLQVEQGGVKKSALIEEFKKEHSGFVEAFKEVKGLGVQTKEGHTKLMSLLPDLLNHLWSEDQRLYPILRKASEHNKKLKEILSFFVNGLGGIHEKILDLMVKYSEGVKDNNFQRDYENLFGDLSKRIEYEENILFLEYRMLKY